MNEPVAFQSPAVERGVGFFETILLVGRRAIHWDAHLKRFLGTPPRFDLPAPERDEIAAAATAILDRSPAPDDAERGLRIAFIAVGADLDQRDSWRLDVSVREIPAPTKKRRAGAHAVTIPEELRRDSPSVKSTSYFASVMGLRYARKRGGDEGLFRTSDGCYLEGTSTGLVAWAPEALRVSSSGVLGSVTTGAFLNGRGAAGRITKERICAGALLLGSLTKAVPILSLDGEPCATPDGMLDEIRAFNHRLVSDPAWQTAL